MCCISRQLSRGLEQHHRQQPALLTLSTQHEPVRYHIAIKTMLQSTAFAVFMSHMYMIVEL